MGTVWRKRTPPAPENLTVPDDISEARAMREDALSGLIEARKQAPLVRWMTDVLIDREGKNHYMETLYQHVPRGAP